MVAPAVHLDEFPRFPQPETVQQCSHGLQPVSSTCLTAM
jgi:hypothetical protein